MLGMEGDTRKIARWIDEIKCMAECRSLQSINYVAQPEIERLGGII